MSFSRVCKPKGAELGRARLSELQTFMVMPNVIDAFASLDCSKNIYWGTSAGMSRHFGFYMRGLGYALSWPLVRRPLTVAGLFTLSL